MTISRHNGGETRPRQVTAGGARSGWVMVGIPVVGCAVCIGESLEEMGEADAGTLANGLSKDRSNAYRALKRLQAKGYVQSREVPAIQGGGKRVVFWIPQEDAAEIEGMP